MEPSSISLTSITLDYSNYDFSFDFKSGTNYDEAALTDLGFFPSYIITDAQICYTPSWEMLESDGSTLSSPKSDWF